MQKCTNAGTSVSPVLSALPERPRLGRARDCLWKVARSAVLQLTLRNLMTHLVFIEEFNLVHSEGYKLTELNGGLNATEEPVSADPHPGMQLWRGTDSITTTSQTPAVLPA